MKKNTTLIYIHTFLSTFILYYICDTLFYIERGLTTSQYISFVSIAFLVKLIFEIPCGILADKYNKKILLIFSNTLFILATIVFIFSHNYISFAIAIILNAINTSLSSGVVNSLLYEGLEDKKLFNKSLFYNSSFYNISYMIAMILGGYIGQVFGLVYNYYFTLIPFFIDYFILFMLKSSPSKPDESRNNISILKNGLKEVFKNSYLIKIIFTSALLFSSIKLIEESHPEYSANIGMPIFIIGIYTAFILLFCIAGNYIGSKINRKNYNFVLNINPIFSGFCILLVGLLNNYLGIFFILLIYIFSESFDNIMKFELHSNISSKSRVTVESIYEFILGIFGFVFSIAMSILLNFISLNYMYIILGFIVILFGILSWIIDTKKV